MTLAAALADFQASTAQCDALIANAHRVDPTGAPLFPLLDRKQITIAAFLNLFIAWESFLEDALTKAMTGLPTLSGATPVRYVFPINGDAARALIIGINRYFDYANIDNVRKLVSMFFLNGYPFEPHLGSTYQDLLDLRTMRNASAHVTSTTQKALEALAQRLFATPKPGIELYDLLLTVDPRSTGGNTVFSEYRDKLLAAAALIAQG